MERNMYTIQELESFVNGVMKAKDIVKSKDPDILIVPLGGAIPFIDLFSISDPDYFSVKKTEFPPSSSRFENLDKMMEAWYYNFLKVNFAEKPLYLMSIDEIVGGGSTVRNHNYVSAGIRKYAKEEMKDLFQNKEDFHYCKEFHVRIKELEDKIKYESVGIMYEGENEQKAKKYAKKRRNNKAYTNLVNEGKIIPIGVKKIITEDEPQLTPIRFTFVKNGSRRGHFIPQIAIIEYSNEYLDFLKNSAQYLGIDPTAANPSNINNFRSFEKYLSEGYKN